MASLQPMSGNVGQQFAAHLLRRATYHYTSQHIDAIAGMTFSDAVDSLFIVPPHTYSEPIDYQTGQPFINSGVEPQTYDGALRDYIAGWWIHEALLDPSISHKMQFFLHSIFVISFDGMGQVRSCFDYLELLNHYATGSYKTLAFKMTLDNAMLRYLNGDDNTKNNPNENYAREFLELFTIGKGPQLGPGNYTNYTEDDILVAAKLLTGWKDVNRPLPADPAYIDAETGLMAGFADFGDHDLTDKTFSSSFGNLTITAAIDEADMYRELGDFVDMIFNQDETARTICRRLYRYFVSSEINSEIENDIIEPLAVTLRTNNYDLGITLKQLLKSQHFYDADDNEPGNEIIGSLIKSPLELMSQIVNIFEISILPPQANPYEHYHQYYKNSVLQVMFQKAGLNIFEPESVAGYSAYYQEPGYHRNWLDSSTIIARYKTGEMYLTGRRILSSGDLGGNIQLDIIDFIANSGLIPDPTNAESIVDILVSYLLPYPLSTERKNYLYNEVLLDELSPINWYFEWLNFQNSGDATNVRIPLENLVNGILFSQEFQLM